MLFFKRLRASLNKTLLPAMSVSRYPTKSPYFLTDTHVLEDLTFSLLPSPLYTLIFRIEFSDQQRFNFHFSILLLYVPKTSKFW